MADPGDGQAVSGPFTKHLKAQSGFFIGKYCLSLGHERNIKSHPLHSEEKGIFPPGWKTLQGTIYHSLMSSIQSAFQNNCQSL